MGYRSDVAYVIKFKDIETRDQFVTLMLAKNDKLTTQAISETAHDYDTDPIITFEMKDVKWYDSYTDVQAHYALLRQANELYEARYRLKAIGEDGVEESRVEDDDGDLDNYVSTVYRLYTSF